MNERPVESTPEQDAQNADYGCGRSMFWPDSETFYKCGQQGLDICDDCLDRLYGPAQNDGSGVSDV